MKVTVIQYEGQIEICGYTMINRLKEEKSFESFQRTKIYAMTLRFLSPLSGKWDATLPAVFFMFP